MKPFFDLPHLNSLFSHADEGIRRAASPWTIWLDADRAKRQIVIGKESEIIASLPHGPKGWLNAQFIRRACNAHDTVIAALTDVGVALGYGSYEGFEPEGVDLHVDRKTIRKIQVALDLVKAMENGAPPF